MDLEPFRRINPCGLAGLEVTQLADLGARVDPHRVARELAELLTHALGYASWITSTRPELR